MIQKCSNPQVTPCNLAEDERASASTHLPWKADLQGEGGGHISRDKCSLVGGWQGQKFESLIQEDIDKAIEAMALESVVRVEYLGVSNVVKWDILRLIHCRKVLGVSIKRVLLRRDHGASVSGEK